MHATRHHADDLVFGFADFDRHRIAWTAIVKEAIPECETDDRRWRRIAPLIRRVEDAAVNRAHTNHREQFRGNGGDQLVLVVTPRLNQLWRELVADHRFGGMKAGADRLEAIDGRRTFRAAAEKRRSEHGPVVVGDVWMTDRVEEREHRRVHGQREPKREHRDHRENRAPSEGAECVTQGRHELGVGPQAGRPAACRVTRFTTRWSRNFAPSRKAIWTSSLNFTHGDANRIGARHVR